jgi:PLP dependent protein
LTLDVTRDTELAKALADTKARIAAAANAASRRPDDIDLVAVSKTYGITDIGVVIAAGQRVFGENRVQEAQSKWPELKARWPGLELHLIGPLQSNKASDAVALFDVIETVDREKIAAELAREIRKQAKSTRLYVQVNTGLEPQKAGIAPDAALAFVARCRAVHGLSVEGLMCIPPADEDPLPHFALLADLARQAGLEKLSMGMSGDFAAAISCGATHVRVGSAIFGSRPVLR